MYKQNLFYHLIQSRIIWAVLFDLLTIQLHSHYHFHFHSILINPKKKTIINILKFSNTTLELGLKFVFKLLSIIFSISFYELLSIDFNS